MRTVCKFWREGRCRNGELCTFAHGEHELGTPIRRREAVEARAVAEPMLQAPKVMKRTLCKYWQEGKCRNADRCTWAHGEHEIGSLVTAAEADPDPPPTWNGYKHFEEASVDAGSSPAEEDPYQPPTWNGYVHMEEAHEEAGSPPAEEDSDQPPTWKGYVHSEEAHEEAAVFPAEEDPDQPPTWNAHALPEEAPAFSVGAAKRTICRFWQEGRCKNGNFCTWAHGEEEIGMPALAPAGEATAPPLALALPAPEEAPWRTGGKGYAGTKRTVCKFWQQGLCERGDQCTWAHSDGEASSQIDGGRPSSIRAGACGSSIVCSVPLASWSFPSRPGPPPLAIAPPGYGDGPPQGRVKYRPAGSLAIAPPGYGDGPPKGSRTHGAVGGSPCGVAVYGHSRSSGGGQRSYGSGHADGLGRHAGPIKPLPAGPTTPVKGTRCKFWLQGQCARGEQCTWLHGEAEPQPPWSRPSSGHPAKEQPRDATVRRTICKFWELGTCTKAPGQCSWAHGESELGTVAMADNREPCKFFPYGNCKKGSLCPFAHEGRAKDDVSGILPMAKRARFL